MRSRSKGGTAGGCPGAGGGGTRALSRVRMCDQLGSFRMVVPSNAFCMEAPAALHSVLILRRLFEAVEARAAGRDDCDHSAARVRKLEVDGIPGKRRCRRVPSPSCLLLKTSVRRRILERQCRCMTLP